MAWQLCSARPPKLFFIALLRVRSFRPGLFTQPGLFYWWIMNTFIGTKIINAVAMTRQEYNDFRGWKLPADENGADAGYLVEYLDGGQPNTEHYAGYVSWSPAEQFEKAYISIGNVDGMPAHMVRVAGERAELADRLNKLNNFIGGDAFASLSFVQQDLLRKQSEAMQTYLSILDSRLGGN